MPTDSYKQYAHKAALGDADAMESFQIEAPSEVLAKHGGDVQAAAADVADEMRKSAGTKSAEEAYAKMATPKPSPAGKPAPKPTPTPPKAEPPSAPASNAALAPQTIPAAQRPAKPTDETGLVGYPPKSAPAKPTPGAQPTMAQVAKAVKAEPESGRAAALVTLAKMKEGPLEVSDINPEAMAALTAAEAENLLIDSVISKATYDAVMQRATARARESLTTSSAKA